MKAHIQTIDDSFVVTFPFNRELLKLIKAIDGRRWKPQLKAWVYPASPTSAGDLARAAKQVGAELGFDEPFGRLLRAHAHAIKIVRGNDPLERIVLDVRSVPMHHQLLGVDLIRVLPGCYLAWQMGTGKSAAVVYSICNFGYRRTLIVCPKAVIPEWVGQFELHGNGKPTVVPMDKRSTKANAKLAEKHRNEDGQVVFVVNYESVWRGAVGEFVKSVAWDLVVADEAQYLKSYRPKNAKKDKDGKKKRGSAVSEFMVDLGKTVGKRVALSGTPITNNPMDLFAQYLFVDPGVFGNSFVAYRTKFAVMGGFQDKDVVGFRNLPLMKKRCAYVSHRITKAEALDLPEETNKLVSVELSDKTRRLYEDLQGNFVLKMDEGEITVANALVELLRLQQMLGGNAVLDDGTDMKIGDEKEKALEEQLKIIGPEEPAVIFCRFTHDMDSAMHVCQRLGYGHYELSGRVKQAEDWKAAGKDHTILIVQIQSGGVGLNLTRASYDFFYSIGFSMGLYMQARSRTHRKGQERGVTHVHLVGKSWGNEPTVDEIIYTAILKKLADSSEAVGEDDQVVADIMDAMKGFKRRRRKSSKAQQNLF